LSPAQHFFFYGTLIAGSGNRFERAAHAALGPGVAGQVQGALYAVPDPQGWYPALMEGSGLACGMVYPVLAGLDVQALDVYEGVEYRRQAVEVATAAGSVWAQAYVWAGALPHRALPIADGDFLGFAREYQLRLFEG